MLIVSGFSQRATPAGAQGGVTTKVVAAANAFLATLSDAERGGPVDFNSDPQRTGWSNLPSGIFSSARDSGSVISRPAQRTAALGVVRSRVEQGGISEGHEHHERRRGAEEPRRRRNRRARGAGTRTRRRRPVRRRRVLRRAARRAIRGRVRGSCSSAGIISRST